MNSPPPPGYDPPKTVQAPGGGEPKAGLLEKLAIGGLIVAGIFGVAAVAREVANTTHAAAKFVPLARRNETDPFEGMSPEDVELILAMEAEEEERRRNGKGK